MQIHFVFTKCSKDLSTSLWNENGPKGAKKFLDKFYRLYSDEAFVSKWTDEEVPALDYIYNFTVKKITEDFEVLHYNTGISQLMVCVSEFYKSEKLPKKMLLGLCQLLSPICPHLGQECYSLLGFDGMIDYVKWPSYDETKLNLKPVTYAIQVNGKLRGKLDFKKDCTDEELETVKEKALEVVKAYTEGKNIVKVIAVKNRIVSIVVK